MPKGIFLIVPALFIDGLQALVSMGLAEMAAPPATIPVVGQVVAAYTVPAGIVLGFFVNFAIALSFGTGLILAMGMMGMFSWRAVPAYFGETVPMFNNLPVWTGLVIWCVYKKHKEDKRVAAGAAALARERKTQEILTAQQETSLRGAARTVAQAVTPARRVGAEVAASFLLFLSLTATAHAQGVDPVRFLVSPETPGPNEVVRVEAQGVGNFLGESNITWSRNGTRELSGVGERIFTFTAGTLGERTTVRVVIDSASQGTITRDLVFVPSLVNLVWEADTYTPLLYKGKALYTGGAPLKVVAYPVITLNGSRVANSSLSFQWRRNDEAVASASGLGRNVFSFVGDQLQASEEVGVDIYIGNSKVGQGRITIPASEPLLLLYNRDALRGVEYEQALPQSIALTGREITLQAEPYYIANTSKNSGRVSYTWLLNNEETAGPDSAQGVLTLRQEGGGSGAALVEVAAQNENGSQLVQRAEARLQISFGEAAAQQDPFSNALGAAVATFNRIAQTNERPLIIITPPQRPWADTSVFTGVQQYGLTPTQNQTANVQADGSLGYQPLEPLSSFGNTQTGTWNFEYYLRTAFSLLIIIGALMAVLMLTLGGVTYMVSEVAVTKMQALERAKAAVYGLLIIGGAWLILNTINPNLLRFNLNFGSLGNTPTIRDSQPPTWNPSTAAELTEKIQERETEPLTGDKCLQYEAEYYRYNNILGQAYEGVSGVVTGLYGFLTANDWSYSTFADLSERAKLVEISVNRCRQLSN